MDNVYAFRLARAAKHAEPGGDYIDYGWSLLKALHNAGFDIVPREPLNAGDPRRTLNEMCGLTIPNPSTPIET